MGEMDLAKEREEEIEVTGSSIPGAPDPGVPDRPVRRLFTTEYKLRILKQADGCNKPGELGALLRREGLYYSNVRRWRKQQMEGTLAGLSPKKRGRKADDELTKENKHLSHENEGLRRKLDQARTVIEVQKELSELLGATLPKTDPIEED